MKKTYTKPLIAMESFQLNAAIAGACKDDPNKMVLNHYQSTCTSFDVYFGSACASSIPGGIDVTVPGFFEDEEGHCYHGPMDMTKVYLES